MMMVARMPGTLRAPGVVSDRRGPTATGVPVLALVGDVAKIPVAALVTRSVQLTSLGR